MDKLKWNEFENAFECVNCQGIYGKKELQRVFAYGEVRNENFQPCHCMDCGTLWTEVELEGYDE